jgi:diaminopimelate decarboxylase
LITLLTTGFHWRPEGLTCDGVLVAEIAAAVGTPFYLYSGQVVRTRLDALGRAFAGVPHAIHYALKANSTLALVRLIRSAGAGADANSIGEIDVALRAGFIPEQIVFTGVGKTREELDRAVSLGLKAINVESAGELERVEGISRAQGARTRVAIRVNPDIDPETHAHISTGMSRNKFGVPLEDAAALYRAHAASPGVEFVGIHAHIGSQIRNLEPLKRAAQAVSSLAKALRAEGIVLEHVDVGGGLGVSYDGAEEPDVAAYGAAISEAVKEAGTSLVLEPGRWLMAPAGVLVATVVDTKPAPDRRRFVVLDASMTELIRPALYNAFHRIAMVAPRAGAGDVPCDVVGPVCESSDTFGRDRALPDPRVDDLVAILDAGAYGSVMASNYNRRPLPLEVLVDQGAWRIVRRRQTVEEQLACEA